jgi:hypothetical protein
MTIWNRSCTLSDIEPSFDLIGTRDFISTPPETPRSSCTAMVAAAASKVICIEDGAAMPASLRLRVWRPKPRERTRS